MRLPLRRFAGVDTPIAWWEWLFAPVVLATLYLTLFVVLLGAIPYLILYPERQAFDLDFGTERQQELMGRFRRRSGRVSIWRRIVRTLTFYWFRRWWLPSLTGRRRRPDRAIGEV